MDYHETHLRQLEVLPEAARHMGVTVIGVGGIGSHVVDLLARMGFTDILVCDPDEVAIHNLSTQLYTQENIGEKKVKALAEKIERDYGLTIVTAPDKFDKSMVKDITICCVDDMDTRKEIFEQCDTAAWYIEGRMGLEMARVYALSLFDQKAMKLYQSTLYPSSEATTEPCSARSIAYNTYFIASIIASIARKIVAKEPIPTEVIGNIGSFNLIARNSSSESFQMEESEEENADEIWEMTEELLEVF